jgi:hypothetical protein
MEGQRSTYRYDPLNEAKREIRLLHLLPPPIQQPGDSPTIDIIRCTFSLPSLDEPLNLDFEALSYVWGDPKGVMSIDLEGHEFPVTANLHCALRHLRLNDRERILWIDALCINQDNDNERTSQVAQMRYIYGLASTVVVFLGEMWEGCNIAMDFIDAMAGDPSLHFDSKLDPHVVVHGMDINSHALREHITKFFNSPWFRRTWTVQEYLLAQRVIFQYGWRLMNGDCYRRGLETYFRHSDSCCLSTSAVTLWDTSDDVPLHTRISIIGKLDAVTITSGYSLITVAMMFRDRLAYDPRDKIYGLLGIVREDYIQADYNASTKDVFTGVAMSSIRENQSLDILSYGYGTRHPDLDIPSFVPDWTAYVGPICAQPLQNRMTIVGSGVYDACNGTQPDFKLVSPSEAASKCIIVDVICEISRVYHVDRWQQMAANSYNQAVLGNKTPYTSQEGAFVEALCGAIFWSSGHFYCWEEGNHPAYLAWKAWIGSKLDPALNGVNVASFNIPHLATSEGRNFIVTQEGYIGWAPENSSVGDLVVVMPGGDVPYILRPIPTRHESELGDSDEPTETNELNNTTEAPRYTFIGDAYIQGIMDGEFYDEEKLESIILV